MGLDMRLAVDLVATLTGTPNGVATSRVPAIVQLLLQLANGTAAGQADRMYAATRTVGASSSEDLDLVGVLGDGLGGTVSVARIKLLFIRAAAANANNVVVGAAAANAWATFLNATGTATLRPGAFVLGAAGKDDATGYAVTAGTGDLLRVANSGAGTSVTYDILAVGASA